MPEVGGGPSTSIFSAGSVGLMSFQVLFGLATSLPSTGTSFARARKISLRGERERRVLLRVGEHDAVEADLDLDDLGDAVLRAGLDLATS